MQSSVPRSQAPVVRVLCFLLLLALAGIFLVSGISKLVAMDPFIWTFMDLGIHNVKIAAVTAHLFIGLELLTGLFLLAHIYLRSFTYPLTIGLLVALSVYLVYVLATEGNKGDCGCFGNWWLMSPLWALLKNIGMMIAALILRRWYAAPPYKNQELVAMAVGMAALVAPFIGAPLSNQDEAVDLNPLYQNGNHASEELRTGRHVIAFMSLTCPHCREAAKVFRDIYSTDSTLPVFLVLNGLPEHEASFFQDTKAEHVPHLIFKGKEAFIKMAGPYVPSIYYIDNSIIKRRISYPELNVLSVRQWAGK